MKSKSALLATLLILIAGIILSIIHSFDVFKMIIITMGIVFIIPGVIVIATLSTLKQQECEATKVKTNSWVNIMCSLVSGVGSVILGISMIGWNEAYMKFLPIIFGVIVILGGCYHICAMAMALRPIKLPLLLYIMPLLLLVMGAIIVFAPKESLNEHTIVLMTGASLIIFAINSLIELWAAKKYIGQRKNSNQLEVIDIKNDD